MQKLKKGARDLIATCAFCGNKIHVKTFQGEISTIDFCGCAEFDRVARECRTVTDIIERTMKDFPRGVGN
jgi:hypothetical protein